MGVKISDLPASAGAALAMQFEVNNAGTSERLTLAQMFALSTGAVVADTPLLNFAQTWNNAGVAFTGWKLNVTDSASDAASLLAAFQIGGTTKFQISKAGELRCSGGLYVNQSGGSMTGNRSVVVFDSGDGGRVQLSGYLGFGPFNDDAGAAADVFVRRDAAQVLAIRNGTNPQTFRLYNTFTDASNYERGGLTWNTNRLFISTENAGSGAARSIRVVAAGDLELGSSNADRWRLSSAGHFFAQTDNTYDIGANSANRPRNIYLAGDLYVGAFARSIYVLLSGESLLASGGAGIVRVGNVADNDFNRLQFGGTTNSFPSLKRSGAGLHARLADDSAYAEIRGKITTEAAAVSETITPDKTLTLYDVNGTAYKVPCVAA